jgi:hypothetical protein
MHLELPAGLGALSGGGQLRLEYGSSVGRSYRLALKICPNPCCRCHELELRCQPEALSATSISADPLCLRMDFDRCKIILPGQKDMDAAQNLGQAVLQEIAPVHWQLLAQRFFEIKTRLTETDDLSHFTPTFPQDVKTPGGSMVPYYEILPFAERMQVVVDEHTWMTDEQYCLHPFCTCSETAITFIRLDQAPRQRRRKPVTVNVRYDFSTGVFRKESHPAPGNPLPGLLCGALREKYSDLNSILEKRRSKLVRLLEKVAGPSPSKIHPPQVTSPTIPVPEISFSPCPEPTPPQPGRNDPCPCGSGKKFKKCCGRN